MHLFWMRWEEDAWMPESLDDRTKIGSLRDVDY